jgi:hypothetical protein
LFLPLPGTDIFVFGLNGWTRSRNILSVGHSPSSTFTTQKATTEPVSNII